MQSHPISPLSRVSRAPHVSHACAVLAAAVLLQACGGASGPADGNASSAQSSSTDANASATRLNANASANSVDASASPEWLPAVSEGQSFNAGTGKTVRYGAGEYWIEKQLNGEVQCTNNFFGRDPIYGIVKACEIQADAAPPPLPPPPTPPPPTPPPGGSEWQQVAVEWQQFVVSSPKTARYGVEGAWIEKTVSGDAQCSNAFFGSDPKYGATPLRRRSLQQVPG